MNPRNSRLLRMIYYYWRSFISKYSYSKGTRNKVINLGVRVHSRIQIIGNDNDVVIGKGAVLTNSLIHISGNNCRVILKDNCYITEAELFVEDNGCRIEVGSGTFIGRHTHMACTEDGSELIIGGNGMISSYCQVRTGDSHSVTDLEGNRINPAASVYIGEHCWLGEGCKVMKGVSIGQDSVVSAGAIVTKSFGINVLLGGIPAKILKENISWNSKRL